MSSNLEDLLAAARAAPASTRIDHRDAIAAHGDEAVPFLASWLTDPSVAMFACRTLERIAATGSGAAAAALHGATTGVSHAEPIRAEALAALARIGFRPPVGRTSRGHRRAAAGLRPASDPVVVQNRAESIAYLAGCIAARGAFVSSEAAERMARVLREHGRMVHVAVALRMLKDQAAVGLCSAHTRQMLALASASSGDLIEPWVDRSAGYFSFSIQSQIPLPDEEGRTEFAQLIAPIRSVCGDLKLFKGNPWLVTGNLDERASRELASILGDVVDHCSTDRLDVLGVPSPSSFVAGIADVAGNCRFANRFIDGRVRVRLDVLNTSDSWSFAVQLCHLLQHKLGIPVPSITWGHPNLGRGFREHQLNIYAGDFGAIGFRIPHKQVELLKYVDSVSRDEGCPGLRRRRAKPSLADEHSGELPDTLRGRHFDAYWEICRALGCRDAERNGVTAALQT